MMQEQKLTRLQLTRERELTLGPFSGILSTSKKGADTVCGSFLGDAGLGETSQSGLLYALG